VWAQPEHKAHKARQVLLEVKGKLDRLAVKALPDLQDKRVLQEIQVFKDQLAVKVQLDLRVVKEHLVILAHKDLQAVKAIQVFKDQQVYREQWALLAHKETKDLLDQLAVKVFQVMTAQYQDLQAIWDLLAILDLQARKAPQVMTAQSRVLLAHKVI
jgi:hypothetical protein